MLRRSNTNTTVDIRASIKAEIEDLQRQVLSLKEKGPFLQNVRVERTSAGGTASKKAQSNGNYARLRAGKGKLLDNGKKSKYIPVRETDKYQAMCHRGKSIKRIEKKIAQRQQKLKRLDVIAAELGLP